MRDPLEVTITVNTAFSPGKSIFDEKGFKPVGKRSILGEVEGVGHGLDFILNTFENHNIKSSFFVDAAQHCYFGHEPMQEIVDKIKKAGQDTQLLVHPFWYYFDEGGEFPRDDSLADRSVDELKQIISKSVVEFEKLTGKKPSAFRSANGAVDPNLYKALSELEIGISSSVAIEKFIPYGKKFLLNGGRHKFEDVTEIPHFTYQDMDNMGGYPKKTLQIATCSWREMRSILKKAYQGGMPQIVVLMEPSDFIKKKDHQFLEITRNRVNQQRLIKLCEFINENSDEYVAVDFESNAERWQQTQLKNIDRFRIPTRYRNFRKIENMLNRLFWNY
ncbi:hypothetical protein [Pseudemcibacter aquimaris]|uniref:hypothetical protein n=1 Tax=Pseudemcibacter aquimaris TaxID=2857064 RepID=UPI002011E893|nr:hypothetical protein [Pseudemcibacter aquimaris]MCC3860989.1 hypothetical protein [Pseudemcibacter aquimaris]WDU59807.1 hypothetical protein KW060_06005 [Pseudemcibacter aquimaris]